MITLKTAIQHELDDDYEVIVAQTETNFVLIEDEQQQNILRTVLNWHDKKGIKIDTEYLDPIAREIWFDVVWHCQATDCEPEVEYILWD